MSRGSVGTGLTWGGLAIAGMCLLLAGACVPTAADRSTRPDAARSVALATPLASLTPQIEGTLESLRRHVTGTGLRIEQVARPFAVSEPPSIATAPRAVFRIELPDPDDGYLVIYEFFDPEAAARRGAELADHVESGFGQTNYPLDAQFALSQEGATLVFSYWSQDRSASPEEARAAFDAISGFGRAIPIRK
ncbi:hypothetical protein BH20CHL6_BH20CHL6_14130 [soil metagenome]